MSKKQMSVGCKILLAALIVLTFPLSMLVAMVYVILDDE